MIFPSGGVASCLAFTFRERKEKCDWQIFNLIDLDSVKHNKDIDTLKEHIIAVTFSSLEGQCDHCRQPINSPLLKLTQMAQLSLEWVLHCYKNVSHSLKAEQKRLAAAVKKRDELREKNDKRKKIIEELKKELAENNKELKHRRNIIYSQQQMFKPIIEPIMCPECGKPFINEDFVRSHMQRVHPDKPQLLLGEKPPDTVEIAPIDTFKQEMKAFQDRIEQEQTNRDSERKTKLECLKLENEHLHDKVDQLLKQQSRLDIMEKTQEETIKQEVDNFKDWFTQEFKPKILDREKKLQLEIDHLNDQVLLLQKELEASDSERKSENKQAELEVDKLEEQLFKEQHERIAQVENSKWELDNQKQLRTKAIKKLKNKLEIQCESRLQALRTRLEAEKTELLNKLVRMLEIERRRQKMLYEEGDVSPPSSEQHTCLSALRRIFKRRKKKPRAASTKEAVGQIVCENVIRILVSLGAEPAQRGLYEGHDGKPNDRDQRQQIASIVQQVLDDQRSHAALLAVPQEGPPLTTPLPEAPESRSRPTTDPSNEEGEKGEEDRPQSTPERPVSKSRKHDLLETYSSSSEDDEEEEQEDQPPRSREGSITSTSKASPDQNRQKKPPAGGARVSAEKIKEQRSPNEEHAETPNDQHHCEQVAPIVSSLIDDLFSNSTKSPATSSQSNEVSQELPPLPSVHPAPKPRKRASKAGTTTSPETVAPANETPKSSPSPTIDSSSSETTSVWSINSTSQTSQASQSPVLMTHHSGAVKEEEEEEQEDLPQNKQTEAPVRKKVSSNSQQATASAVGVTSTAAMMKRKDEEEDSELKEPHPAPLQGPDQHSSVNKRNSGGENTISDVPARAEKQGEKPPAGGVSILREEDYERLDQDLFSNIPSKRKEESPPAQGFDPMRARLESNNVRWAASKENKSKAALSRAEKQGEKPPAGGVSILREEDYECLAQDLISNIPSKRKEESPPAQGFDPMRARLESDNIRWAASKENKSKAALSTAVKQGEKPPAGGVSILREEDYERLDQDLFSNIPSKRKEESPPAQGFDPMRARLESDNVRWAASKENKSKAALSRAVKQGEKPPAGGVSILREEDYEWLAQDLFSNIPSKRKEESPPAQGFDPMRARLESDNVRWAASKENKSKAALSRAEKQGEKPPAGGVSILREEDYEWLAQDLFSNIPSKRKEESPPAQGFDPMRARLESDNVRWAASKENKSKAALSTAVKQGEKPPAGGVSILREEDYERLDQDLFSNIPSKRKEESPPAQGFDPMRARLESDNVRWAASKGNKIRENASRKEKQGWKPPEKKREILGWDNSLDAPLKNVLMKKSEAVRSQVSEPEKKKANWSNSRGFQAKNEVDEIISKYNKQIERQRESVKILPKR